MLIRHLVTRDNVDGEGAVIDPLQIRHGIIVGRKVAQLAGLIDPLTHLNLDFADHKAAICVIAERFEPGAPVVIGEDAFAVAFVDPGLYRHLGRVDRGARTVAWHQQFAAHREEVRIHESV